MAVPEPFLDPTPFVGETTPPQGPAAYSGQATFDGAVVVAAFARARAAALLPPGLELVAGAHDPGTHPLVFALGEQRDGALLVGGRAVPLGTRYMEFALVLPFVRRRGATTTHVLVVRMCSGYFPAVWHGNAHYGFGKTGGAMGWHGPLFVLTAPDGRLLLHAAVAATTPWQPGACADVPAAQAARALFRLPVLGRRADASLVTSWFDWDYASASLSRADGWISVDGPLVAGLEPGLLPAVAGGSFLVRGMRWRLGWPTPCSP